jgi:hypothetical protein
VEKMIEIRYAGVVVGRASALRELDAEGLFVAIPEPLPVGTPIILGIDERAVAAQVQTVLESADPARSGMRVRFLEPGVAAGLGLPVAPVPVQAPVEAGPGAIPGAPSPSPVSPAASAASAAGLVTEPEDSEVGTEPVGADSGPVFSSESGGVSSDPPGAGSEPAGPVAGGPPRKNRRNRRR